jgi:hypothetical protein
LIELEGVAMAESLQDSCRKYASDLPQLDCRLHLREAIPVNSAPDQCIKRDEVKSEGDIPNFTQLRCLRDTILAKTRNVPFSLFVRP